MKEHPILFSGPMVKAILQGHKTQTRRVVKPQPIKHDDLGTKRYYCWQSRMHYKKQEMYLLANYSPYGLPGDRLWVKETYKLAGALFFRADGEPGREELELYPNWKWKPSIFMPRCFSRITLEIFSVRVERLQAITVNDALAEGTPDLRTIENNWDMRDCFRELWNSINDTPDRPYGWNVNPWVWVIEFKAI